MPSLEGYGVELDTSAAIPKGLSGSDLVIVAAHGGIVPEGRFFQVVADDADLRVSSATLSGGIIRELTESSHGAKISL